MVRYVLHVQSLVLAYVLTGSIFYTYDVRCKCLLKDRKKTHIIGHIISFGSDWVGKTRN